GRLRVKTIQHHLPAAIHGRGLDHFVIGDLCVSLHNSRQGQLGGRHRGMALGVIFIERHQFLLKGIGKQLVAVLPQEHKQLGTAHPFDNGVFCRRQGDGWMPEGWTHVRLSLWSGKKTMVSHAITYCRKASRQTLPKSPRPRPESWSWQPRSITGR